MFGHIFINRIKCLVRDREMIFWTFLFPLILASFFAVAFSNLAGADQFKSIPIAVVNNAEYRENAALQTALNAVSDANPSARDPLFNISLVSGEQAEEDLKKDRIKGYILLDGSAHVVVKESGLDQTILKEFMDSTLQSASAFETIIQGNPAAAQNFKLEAGTYLNEIAPGKTDPNGTLISFYALIAMTCLFGGYWGNQQIADHQANLSPQGARMNLVPVHKLRVIGYSMLAAILIQLLSVLLLIAYMCFALGVDFGDQLGYVLLTGLAGSVMGVSFGALIGASNTKSENFKSALSTAISLTFSFLAGMMMVNVKYIVTHAVPALAWLNPANLITDAFYSLYYYDTYERFYLNIGLLFAFAAVFYLIVYFITRRQKYASI